MKAALFPNGIANPNASYVCSQNIFQCNLLFNADPTAPRQSLKRDRYHPSQCSWPGAAPAKEHRRNRGTVLPETCSVPRTPETGHPSGLREQPSAWQGASSVSLGKHLGVPAAPWLADSRSDWCWNFLKILLSWVWPILILKMWGLKFVRSTQVYVPRQQGWGSLPWVEAVRSDGILSI